MASICQALGMSPHWLIVMKRLKEVKWLVPGHNIIVAGVGLKTQVFLTPKSLICPLHDYYLHTVSLWGKILHIVTCQLVQGEMLKLKQKTKWLEARGSFRRCWLEALPDLSKGFMWVEILPWNSPGAPGCVLWDRVFMRHLGYVWERKVWLKKLSRLLCFCLFVFLFWRKEEECIYWG